MSKKRYYWLKLKEDFFEDDTIQWLEEQENGKDYVYFYMKLCLKSLKSDGFLIRYVGEKLIPYDVKALSRLTGTDFDTVAVALKLFEEIGLIEKRNTGEIYLSQIKEMTGTETRQASTMRMKRARISAVEQEAEEGKGHIPFIEGYANRSRYGGNYYAVFDRDGQGCVACGSRVNLCVHHILGFDERDKETTNMRSMITLCRACHSREHAHPRSIVTDPVLEGIGFESSLKERISGIKDTHGRSNKVTSELQNVKDSYTEIELEKEKELDIEIERDTEKTPPLNYQGIVDFYNNTCKTLPRVIKISEPRKRAIKARLKTYSQEDLEQVFTLANESDFLKGKNNKGWSANFDWLMNEANMVKVLEGNYKNSKGTGKQTFDDFVDIGKEWLNEREGIFDDSSGDKSDLPKF